jgi:hypothetical protein
MNQKQEGPSHFARAFFPLITRVALAHATGRAQCCQESCESGYYHLRHYLNQSILLHNFHFQAVANFSLFTVHYSLA